MEINSENWDSIHYSMLSIKIIIFVLNLYLYLRSKLIKSISLKHVNGKYYQ